MNSFDTAYLDILGDIMDNGVRKGDRTGTGTLSRFGTQARFNLKDNRLPLLSLRKVFHRSFIHETLWFLSGSTDIQYLKENNVSIWDSWVKPGTERYRELSFEECLEKCRALAINLGDSVTEGLTSVDFRDDPLASIETGDWELRFEDDDDVEGGVKAIYVFNEADVIKDIYRYLRTMELKERITAHQVADGWTGVIFVHTPGDNAFWAMESVVLTSVREVIYSDIGKLQELCNKLTGEWIDIEPRVLVGGSIGAGAYGSQWRSWEDTRVVQKNEVPQYLEKGYRFIGDLTHGGCGVVYRKIDQIANVVKQLKENPDSRRIMVIAYNPAKVDECSLPPCHSIFQFWTRELTMEERLEMYKDKHGELIGEVSGQWLTEQGIAERALSCMLYMRSSDYPVGAVFNIPQYALLTHMLAQVTGMVAEELVFTAADCHVYANQEEGVIELLQRKGHEAEARVHLNPEIKDIDQFVFEDIEVTSYEHDPVIRFPVAV